MMCFCLTFLFYFVIIRVSKRGVIMKEMLLFLAGLITLMCISFFGQWLKWSVFPVWKEKRKAKKLEKNKKKSKKSMKNA